MPTKNPRINLTFTQEQYDLVSRLARVQGCSRAAVLMEFFETVVPVLERVVVACEAAERTQVQAKEGLLESVERAEAAISPHVDAAMGQLDWLLKEAVGSSETRSAPRSRERSRAQRGAPRRRKASGPRSVTRGPGRGAGAPKASPR